MAGRKKRPRDCPLCSTALTRFFVSMEETIRMCPSRTCPFPFEEPTKALAQLITPIDFSMDKVDLGPRHLSDQGISDNITILPEGKRGRHLASTPQDLLLHLPPLRKKRRTAIRPPKGMLCTVDNVRATCPTVRAPENYTLAIQLPPA
ncbi:hypothetical protein BCR37DRAFT_397897 [Protomyces lactucae-debilis]|uniref:Uncharacterized protein n=1 Tax=Protomyces lactucae-debilis TaxID=2754530 RepID=A0A1Y2FI36_PROLT|nr:uncharacterized protein BCR37DRAFT_397897 [Protomyces lactucae-debilis]ORY83621.1 hypothetical protein BCR37DRAFT_397897 [Protomyces lactucae-debilis]